MVRVSVYVCVGGERSMVSDWHMYSSAVKPAGTLHEYGTQLSQQLLKNNKTFSAQFLFSNKCSVK